MQQFKTLLMLIIITQLIYQFNTFKGTVCWYQSHVIIHYFTSSEIVMELKVCMILQYLHKDGM